MPHWRWMPDFYHRSIRAHATVNQTGEKEGLGYVQTRWDEGVLNERGIYKDSKFPWLYERLENWAENNR